MPTCDIVVIGASIGGVEALRKVAAGLPSGLNASVFVVLHVWPEGESILSQLLDSAGPLPARHPRNGEPIQQSVIYVAPPDFHMTLKRGAIQLTRGPRENRHRPAIDPLFRSAAVQFGARVAGVVLTGAMDDGTAGLMAIKQRGGKAIVQDPAEAFNPSMPESALAAVPVDYVVTLAEIAPIITELASRPVASASGGPVNPDMVQEERVVEGEMSAIENDHRPGTPSVYTCPECNGTLWELQDDDLLRFRCRIGHAYTAQSLTTDQDNTVERALWTALRSLEESSALHRRIADRARQRNQPRIAVHNDEEADEKEKSARIIRDLVINIPEPS